MTTHIPPSEAELRNTIRALTLALRNVVRRSGLAGFGSRGEKEAWYEDAEDALTKHGREDLLRTYEAGEIHRLLALCRRAEPIVREAAAKMITRNKVGEEWLKFADELRAAAEGR